MGAMVKHGFLSALALASLHFSSPMVFASGTQEKPKAAAVAESLGEAFIAQSSLRIYLSRPASISLHDARGQTLFQLESNRPAEVLPLAGLPTGFLYLTLRSGQIELTKKLVYTGK